LIVKVFDSGKDRGTGRKLSINNLIKNISTKKKKETRDMLEKMKEIIADQLSVDADSITESSSFKDDLGADSLDLFELVMALEDEYSVEIPAEDLQNLLTVGEVINYLKEKGVE
jgi:acyl carrier protein